MVTFVGTVTLSNLIGTGYNKHYEQDKKEKTLHSLGPLGLKVHPTASSSEMKRQKKTSNEDATLTKTHHLAVT